jgi:hypothetical protein
VTDAGVLVLGAGCSQLWSIDLYDFSKVPGSGLSDATRLLCGLYPPYVSQ